MKTYESGGFLETGFAVAFLSTLPPV